MNTPVFIVHPNFDHATYWQECKFCGCEGWHVYFDNGSIRHADGKTYAYSAIVARMIMQMGGVRSNIRQNGTYNSVGEGGKSQ